MTDEKLLGRQKVKMWRRSARRLRLAEDPKVTLWKGLHQDEADLAEKSGYNTHLVRMEKKPTQNDEYGPSSLVFLVVRPRECQPCARDPASALGH